MKRIEAVIKAEKLDDVSSALKDVGVGGFTILPTKGRGSGERPTLRGGRGTLSYVAEFDIGNLITTIVDDSRLDEVITAISNAAYTGKAGDGIVIVTNINDVLNISSKKRGSDAL